jgi:hypothetical protein
MKKILKFSKKISDVSSLKKDFFTENNIYLKKSKKEYRLYKKEKKRIKCKNCEKKLKSTVFISHNIDYTICEKCFHLNGLHEDTTNFLNKLYLTSKGSNYEYAYKKDFNLRVKKIYTPKLEFLKKVLKKNFSVIELGSGAGHFLKACENQNISAEGYDVNKELLNIAKKNLKKNKALFIKPENIYKKIKSSKRDVMCLISTLEHLENPNEILKFIKKSKIKYLYLCVPLFSLSTFIENVFQNIYPRQLNASHTHLYTEKSLKHMIKANKFKILGEWWFGTDISDLYRGMYLNFKYKDKKFLKYFDIMFGSCIDDLQNVLDKKKLSCEVHMVLKI